MKPGPLQEQDGAWSMRRVSACACFANAVSLSWQSQTQWQTIALFLGVGLVLLGLTTVSDLRTLATGISPSGGTQ